MAAGEQAERPPPGSWQRAGLGARYLQELHGHEAEPLLLEALDDLAHQAALHAVRLDGDERALLVGHGLRATDRSAQGPAAARTQDPGRPPPGLRLPRIPAPQAPRALRPLRGDTARRPPPPRGRGSGAGPGVGGVREASAFLGRGPGGRRGKHPQGLTGKLAARRETRRGASGGARSGWGGGPRDGHTPDAPPPNPRGRRGPRPLSTPRAGEGALGAREQEVASSPRAGGARGWDPARAARSPPGPTSCPTRARTPAHTHAARALRLSSRTQTPTRLQTLPQSDLPRLHPAPRPWVAPCFAAGEAASPSSRPVRTPVQPCLSPEMVGGLVSVPPRDLTRALPATARTAGTCRVDRGLRRPPF